MNRSTLIPRVGLPPLAKAGLLMAALMLIGYFSQSFSGTLVFAGLGWVLTLGRTVLVGALVAVLLGVCFPYVGLALAVIGMFYVVITPTAGAST